MRIPALARLVMIAAAMIPALAHAQLRPTRTYYGVGRPIPMTVDIPAGSTGEAEVRLLEPVTARPLAKASVAAGKVDLATLFPSLWQTGTAYAASKAANAPKPTLSYAQLFVGDKKIGPAVVLQPMTDTPRATLDTRDPNAPQVTYAPDEQPGVDERYYTGVRAYVDQHVVMETTVGTIEMQLRPDVAPNTVWNFRDLVAGGYYTDVTFWRIIASDGMTHKGFVIQGGDPSTNDATPAAVAGNGGPGFEYNLEPSTLPHDFGVISMARTSRPNTNGSQFFICLTREATQRLDHLYCAFAQCVSGADVIMKLANVQMATGSLSKPLQAPRIISARLVDAPPYGEGPRPLAEQAAAAGNR